MSKKSTKPTALVSAGERQTPAKRKSSMPAVIPATANGLLPVLRSEFAVAKLVGTGGEIEREDGVVLVTGRGYRAGENVVPAAEIYYDRKSSPEGDGPWLGEADKVSWRDEATGYECIMLRDTCGGFLCGYVGVPSDHPLWGWDSGAVPSDIGIDVHGGITYSRACQSGPTPARSLLIEARRICDVVISPAVYQEVTHATDHRVQDHHAWWFGFSCDHAYDLIPGDRRRAVPISSSELAQTYRDDAYVVRETLALAAQLRAIVDGTEAPPRDRPPPIGLDPRRGGGRG